MPSTTHLFYDRIKPYGCVTERGLWTSDYGIEVNIEQDIETKKLKYCELKRKSG